MSFYTLQLHLATARLERRGKLRPPPGALQIHDTYIKAITFSVEARTQQLNLNHFHASAAFQISSEQFDLATKMWQALGVE